MQRLLSGMVARLRPAPTAPADWLKRGRAGEPEEEGEEKQQEKEEEEEEGGLKQEAAR